VNGIDLFKKEESKSMQHASVSVVFHKLQMAQFLSSGILNRLAY
jgi:hypothetical protein